MKSSKDVSGIVERTENLCYEGRQMVQWKESEKELHLKYQLHDKQGWPTNKLI